MINGGLSWILRMDKEWSNVGARLFELCYAQGMYKEGIRNHCLTGDWNGGEIFYGKARINPAQPGALVAAEFPEPLRAASRQYIITSRAIYNRATGTKIADLSSEALLATAGDDGMIFTYRKVATNHYLIKQKLSQ